MEAFRLSWAQDFPFAWPHLSLDRRLKTRINSKSADFYDLSLSFQKYLAVVVLFYWIFIFFPQNHSKKNSLQPNCRDSSSTLWLRSCSRRKSTSLSRTHRNHSKRRSFIERPNNRSSSNQCHPLKVRFDIALARVDITTDDTRVVNLSFFDFCMRAWV